MNLTHVTSLEMSKKLVENGWTKETEFLWVVHKEVAEPDYANCIHLSPADSEIRDYYPVESWEYFKAPLATEILEELPEHLEKVEFLSISKITIGLEQVFRVTYEENEFISLDKTSDSLPNALAEMWIYLKQKGLIK